MRLLIFLLVFASSSYKVFAHGGHMATFSIQYAEKYIILEFKIDASTLDHYPLNEAFENYNQMKALCLSQYIKQNSSLSITEKRIDFELIDSNQNEDFFILRMKSKEKINQFKSLKFETDCFYSYDNTFENRVIIQSESGENKSYRMTNKKRILSIENI